MASYDSDDSLDDDQDYTETDVLLGYASKESKGGETISKLGGRPVCLSSFFPLLVPTHSHCGRQILLTCCFLPRTGSIHHAPPPLPNSNAPPAPRPSPSCSNSTPSSLSASRVTSGGSTSLPAARRPAAGKTAVCAR